MRDKNKGFTLLELIVVIAIMAVLIGVLVPTYISHVKKASRSKVLQEADTIVRILDLEFPAKVASGEWEDKKGTEEWTDKDTGKTVGVISNYSFYRIQSNQNADLKDTVSNDLCRSVVKALPSDFKFWQHDNIQDMTFGMFLQAAPKNQAGCFIVYDNMGCVKKMAYSRKGFFVYYEDGNYQIYDEKDKGNKSLTFDLASYKGG